MPIGVPVPLAAWSWAGARLARPLLALLSPALLLLASRAAWGSPDNFESPPVHPIERSPDGSRLFAVHTADARLVIFDLTTGDPVWEDQVPVGIEPVTVRARSNTEVWVVNHLSDSISIIDLGTRNVVRTLLVGDEPTDVVFAGNPERAFVCVSQKDRIEVFDPGNLDLAPVLIPIEGRNPRSLAVAPDGNSVYVTVMDSGNRTTVIPFGTVAANGGPPAPNPPMDPGLPAAPQTALIVSHDGAHWIDEADRDWSPLVPYTLPDQDLFELSASTLAITRSWTGVGTSLFNLAVHPITGQILISNHAAQNAVRFEPNLKGRFLQNRVTIVDPLTSTVTPLHLNGHIDYGQGGSPGERSLSLSFPLDLAVREDGSEWYLAAFGSGKVAVLDDQGAVVRRIAVGQGPAGLALDEARSRLYVLNRFSSSISSVDLSDDSSVQVSLGFDPSSPAVREGRRFLYDGELSSAHGDLSCGSCHLFGGMDNLAWDLGDPTGDYQPPPQPIPGLEGFHPMKGPMVTQSFKALRNTEPLHWRGDRRVFRDFNPAFVSLMGRGDSLSAAEIVKFRDFVFTLRYPPNPNRNLDGSLPNPPAGPNPTRGEQVFRLANIEGGNVTCITCHQFPTGENGIIVTDNLLLADQDMKVPQLRNLYEKTRFDNEASMSVRGFGYTHDGASDDLFSFLQFPGFAFADDDQRRDVAAFLLCFDTGTHAAVGAQWTMDGSNETAGLSRINTLVGLANDAKVGLIAKGRDLLGVARGWTYQGRGLAFRPTK
ncbi:MAG: hypothetical protein IPK72_03705 [Candidatus Eisenbacteria bacterium]|nr:hypothetical protein [Candidatus Eisenbacteria bacterium]